MIKRLLSSAMIAACALGAYADEFPLNSLVYSSGACYKIAGDNLLSNSDFANGFNGWTSINATNLDEVFTVEEGAGPNGIKAIKSIGASANGLYQSVPVSVAGTYVLVFQVKGNAAGFTQASHNADYTPLNSGVNYVNLIFNAEGTPAGATNRVELPIGEGGSYGTDDWSTICVPIEVTGTEVEGYVVPEIAALAGDVLISNVELHLATGVFDSRTAQNFKDYCQAIYDGYNWANDQVYEDEMGEPREFVSQFSTAINELQSAIDAKDGIEGKKSAAENMLKKFLESNTDEMMQYKGSGNGSLSWANWTAKYNAFIGKNSPGGADVDQWAEQINEYWRFNTDRWCHKNAAVNEELGIQWMTGSSGDWDNIATATVTLEKGTYFFGFEGEGGRGTANKNDWKRSLAVKSVWFEYWFNGDTVAAQPLDPALRQKYIHAFTLDKDSTVTFGIRCNNSEPVDRNNWHSNGAAGMFTSFYAPVLYKVYTGAGLSEDQKAYLEDVEVQLTELGNRLETAKKDLDEDASRPWGKDAYRAAYNDIKKQYDDWKALTEDEIIEQYYDNDEVLADSIYTNAGKPIKDTYRAQWLELNKPFTNLKDSIDYGNEMYNSAFCELYPERTSLNSVVQASQSTYNTLLNGATSEFVQNDSISLAEAAHNVIVAVDAFKVWLSGDPILDIDFANAAVKNDDETYSILGTIGQMDFASGEFNVWGSGNYTAKEDANSKTFVQGYWDGTETALADVLRVGNGTATAAISDENIPNVATPDTEIGSSVDIVNVSFDFYFGYLNKAQNWFTLQDVDGNTIVHQILGDGNNEDQLGLTSKYTSTGSSSVSNAGIYNASGNKTHVEVILNYGTQKMTATLTSGRGTVTTSDVPMQSAKAIKYFQVGSNYSNGDRRSWFDNLRIGVTKNGSKVYSVPSPDVTLGDVDGDGNISMSDANEVVTYFLASDADKATMVAGGFNAAAADINADGDISMNDANEIVTIFLGGE